MLRSFPSRSGLLRRALAPALLVACGPSYGAVLTVGASRQYVRIEEAYAAAQPGDTIAIYPAVGDGIYRQPALRVSKPRLQFVGQGARPVILDGEGFEYSGIGPIPRAILQVEPDAQGVVIARDLIASIEENRQPFGSVYDGRAALEMILAVYESHRHGGVRVPLPLASRSHLLARWREDEARGPMTSPRRYPYDGERREAA
ncbi:MAG TPA: hypothetical protein VFB21_14750 [Chthonomonadaceae bacterium]|nr:hypothetical protein [Chthonomonadaceae bacterium]